MEKVRPWCGQPSDRGRLKNTTERMPTDRITELGMPADKWTVSLKVRLHFLAGCTTDWTKRFEYSCNKQINK